MCIEDASAAVHISDLATELRKQGRPMGKSAAILFAVGLFVSGFTGVAEARGGGGGHGGGGHGGGGGHYGGGGFRGGYGYGVGLGLGLGALYYGYPYYGYPYYPYSDGYGDYGYPSNGYPAPPPPPYPGPDPSAIGGSPDASAGPASGQYWYHCDSPEGYYPYVQNRGEQ